MSGIEVAGLVLGAFPIVISALEGYRDAFTPLKRWWEFQRTFEELIDDVGTQYVFFENNLEKLLSPFVDSEAHMGILLGDPFGPSWKSQSLDAKLQARLGKSFRIYQNIVGRMNEVLLDLQKSLGLTDGKALHLWQERKPGRVDLEREFQRLKISFSKKRSTHVGTLSKRNDDLKNLLQFSDELAPHRSQRRTSPGVQMLRQLQIHASGLYTVLDKAWLCSCQSAHVTHLRLEGRTDTPSAIDRQWKLLLPTHVQVSTQSSLAEVYVNIEQDKGVSSAITIQPNSAPGLHSAISRFEGEPGVQITHASTSSSVKNTNKFGSHDDSYSMADSYSTTGTTSSLKLLARTKISKSVQFITGEPKLSDSVMSVLSAPSEASSEQMQSICTSLSHIQADGECLGYLEDQQEQRYTFYVQKMDATELDLTLQTALTPASNSMPSKALSRRDRYTIAVILASSLLQLHSTPWLTEQRTKSDTILHADAAQESVLAKPCLRAEFHGTSSQTHPGPVSTKSAKFNTRKALSNLGIMLLELCFGKPIQEHRLRPQFYGPNNRPNAFIDISTARVWHEDVLDEVGDDISDAIRRCLDCSFAPKPNIQDKEFQEAVFDGVVTPLQELLKVWEKK